MYYVPPSNFAVVYGGEDSGTVSSLLDLCGYVLAAGLRFFFFVSFFLCVMLCVLCCLCSVFLFFLCLLLFFVLHLFVYMYDVSMYPYVSVCLCVCMFCVCIGFQSIVIGILSADSYGWMYVFLGLIPVVVIATISLYYFYVADFNYENNFMQNIRNLIIRFKGGDDNKQNENEKNEKNESNNNSNDNNEKAPQIEEPNKIKTETTIVGAENVPPTP